MKLTEIKNEIEQERKTARELINELDGYINALEAAVVPTPWCEQPDDIRLQIEVWVSSCRAWKSHLQASCKRIDQFDEIVRRLIWKEIAAIEWGEVASVDVLEEVDKAGDVVKSAKERIPSLLAEICGAMRSMA